MTPEDITVRYRWTFEALLEATRWRLREVGWWRTAGIFWLLAAIGVGLAATGAVTGQYFPAAWGAFLVLFALFVLRGKAWGIAGQVRRQYAASNHRDAEIEWRFTESTILIRDPHGSAELTWESLIQCVRTPAGIMLYTHPGIFHWLPLNAFATEAEFATVADMARRYIAVYRELR